MWNVQYRGTHEGDVAQYVLASREKIRTNGKELRQQKRAAPTEKSCTSRREPHRQKRAAPAEESRTDRKELHQQKRAAPTESIKDDAAVLVSVQCYDTHNAVASLLQQSRP